MTGTCMHSGRRNGTRPKPTEVSIRERGFYLRLAGSTMRLGVVSARRAAVGGLPASAILGSG